MENYSKKQIIMLSIGMLIMFAALIIHSMIISNIGISALSAKYYAFGELTHEGIINTYSAMRLAIIEEVGIFAVLEIVSFIMFLLKKEKVQKIILVINIIFVVIYLLDIIAVGHLRSTFITAVPTFNTIIYMLINRERKS